MTKEYELRKEVEKFNESNGTNFYLKPIWAEDAEFGSFAGDPDPIGYQVCVILSTDVLDTVENACCSLHRELKVLLDQYNPED